jgi:aldose sugar dehydrogenase
MQCTSAARRFALLLLLVLPLTGACQPAQPTDESLRVVSVAQGLAHPWSLAFLPDGEILVTERPGTLRVIRQGRLLEAPVAGVPEVAAIGQGGLLDVVPHPQFAENRLIYLSYAARSDGGLTTRVARGHYENGELANVDVIFEAQPASATGRHFGSRLVFDAEGYLYITIGDRGEMERAQHLDDHAGTVVRLHDDGSVPDDNPFRDAPDALPEIYSYGHRNAQGMALHPHTGEIWLHEHGARGGDEINVVRPGLNYGWPVITHGIDYSGAPIGVGKEKEGMEQPLHDWTPSIAPSGMAFYTGERFPDWQGDLFVGALVQRHLARLVLDGERIASEQRLLADLGLRIRDVRQGPDGYLWLLTDHDPGHVLRLEPAP